MKSSLLFNFSYRETMTIRVRIRVMVMVMIRKFEFFRHGNLRNEIPPNGKSSKWTRTLWIKKLLQYHHQPSYLDWYFPLLFTRITSHRGVCVYTFRFRFRFIPEPKCLGIPKCLKIIIKFHTFCIYFKKKSPESHKMQIFYNVFFFPVAIPRTPQVWKSGYRYYILSLTVDLKLAIQPTTCQWWFTGNNYQVG